MKKLTKILILVLSVALLAGAFILSASAEEKSYEFDETNMAFVVYADEDAFKADKAANNGYANALGTYNDIADAVAGAKSKSAKYIALRNDWERGTKDFPKGTASISLDVPGMTLDLNGHTMSFSVYSGYIKADGTRETAYTWLTIGTAGGVTIVGNGGAIEATMSIFQHTNAGTLNLVGGKGGLALRAITGMSKKVGGSWTNDQLAANTEYSGGQIIKVGANNFGSNPSTSTLNISGEVTFERANTKTVSAIAYWGATKVNIGIKDGERSTVSYIDKTGIPGIGTQYNNGEATAFLQLGTDDKFDSGTQDIYATKTVSSSCNIVNTDIKIHLENFFYSEVNFYKLADPKYNDDQQYLRIENSTIVGDGFDPSYFSANADYTARKDNIPEKFFYSERISPVCIDIVESRIETYTRTFTFAYDNKNSSKVSFGYVHAVDSVFIGARPDGTKGYPVCQSVGTALFENCSFLLGESVCSGGSPWLPYGQKFADGSDPVWPVFSEELGGAGILIESGCIFLDGSATSYGNTGGSKNADGTWKQKPAKDHPGQNDSGYAQNTCVNINGYKTITVYDLKTNKKGVMVTDDTKKVNHITTPTGINTFNSGVVGKVYKDGVAPSFGESLSWIVTNNGNPRCGMLTVNASKKIDAATGKLITTDNKYITHNYWADTEGKTYAQDYYGSTGAPAFNAGDKTPPLYDIRDSGFYSVDFDLMTTDDEFTGMYVTIYIATVVGGEKKTDMVRLDLTRDGTLESKGIGKGSYKLDFTPGVWQHITAVLEMPTVEVEGKKVVDTAHVTAKSKLHLYIDGVLVCTYDQPLPNGNVEKADSLDFCALNDVRLGFQSSTSKNMYGERNTSVDNFAFARYPVSSTLEEASTYMSKAQKALGIEQPEDIPIATYGEYAITRENAKAGIEEYLRGYFKGTITAPLTLNFDFDEVIDFVRIAEEAGVTFESFTYNTNGALIAVDTTELSSRYDAAAGKGIVGKEQAIVNWYLPDGSIQRTDTVNIGATVDIPYTVLSTNGWYKEMGGWADANGKMLEGTTVKVNESTNFYSSGVSYVPNMVSISYNLRLFSHVGIDLYVPVNSIPKNVKSIKMYTPKMNLSKTEYLIRGGSTYHRFSGLYAGATQLATAYDVTCEIVIEGPSGDVTLSSEFTVSAIGYLENVVENSDYYADFMTVAADLIQYTRQLFSYSGTTNATKTAIDVLYSKTAAWRTNTKNVSMKIDETLIDTSAIAPYVKGISFVASTYAPAFKLDFNDPATLGKSVVDVKFVVDGYLETNDAADYGFNAGGVNYGLRLDKGFVEYYADGSYKSVQSTNISIHNITADVMTIVLTLSDGSTVSGTYSFGAYYAAISNIADMTSSEKSALRTFLKTVKAYSISAADYRYGGKKVYPTPDGEIVVSYDDFNTVGDGITDDFLAIKEAHDVANALKDAGYDVIVKANPEKTYRIGNGFGSNHIRIRTDTDWQGCKFIFDDSEVTYDSVEHSTSIFIVAPDNKSVNVTNRFAWVNAENHLIPGAKNIGWAPGVEGLLVIKSNERKLYIRHGGNQDNGQDQQEIIMVDKYGNVFSDTPVMWDYSVITSAKFIPTEEIPISVGNVKIESISNQGPSEYHYYARNILVTRSATTLHDIEHWYTGELDHGCPYNGINNFQEAANITVQNCRYEDPADYNTIGSAGTTVSMGSYAYCARACYNIWWKNITQSNNHDENGVTVYRPLMGTNYCKNLGYDGCDVGSFDAHCGLYNVTLKNSSLTNVNLIGDGLAYMENVTFNAGLRYGCVTLRSDYGASFKGEIVMKNCKIDMHKKTSTGIIYTAEYVSDHYFGYTCYLPKRIDIDGLSITNSNAKVHLFPNLEKWTSVDISKPASEGGGGGVNPYMPTEVFSIKNAPNIKLILPDTPQFKNMKVFVNGAQVNNWQSIYGHKVVK